VSAGVNAPAATDAITREVLHDRETRAVVAAANRRRVGQGITRVLVLAFFFGTWQALAARYDATLLPGPLAVYRALVRGSRVIADGALATTAEIAIGFAIGAAAGVVLGAFLGQSRLAQRIFHPFLVIYQAVPKTGFAPMIVLVLGFGLMPKVALAAMSSIFPVLENTIVGVRRVDEDTLRLFRGLGASPLQLFFKLRLISALPHIMTGFRAGVILATVSVVVAEFVAGRIGLGAVMMVGTAQLDSALVFAALVVLTLIGLAYYFAALLFEMALLRWFNLAPPAT
jgi:NitT/TauT family transport system permease protein